MRPEPQLANAQGGKALADDSRRVTAFAIGGGLAALGLLMAVSFGPRIWPLPRLIIADIRTENDAGIDPLAASLHASLATSFIEDSSKTAIRWHDSQLSAEESLERLKLDPAADGAKLLSIMREKGSEDLAVELSDAATRKVIWRKSYDPNSAPFPELSARIANDVAKAFGGPPVVNANVDDPTPVAAYELYWRARYLLDSAEPKSPSGALSALRRCVAIAPHFIEAQSALAVIYARYRGEELGLPGTDTIPLARKHLEAAREIDSDAPGVALTDALLAVYDDHDLDSALEAAEDATADEPNSAFAWQTRAMIESAQGLHDRAADSIDRARKHDPLSASLAWETAWYLYVAGDIPGARKAADAAERIGAPVLIYEALIEEGMGHTQKALTAWIERARLRNLAEDQVEEVTRLVEAAKYKEAYALLAAWSATASINSGQEIPTAILALRSGDRDGAIASLSGLKAGRETQLWLWVNQIPALRPLHDSPRWATITRRVDTKPADDPSL